MTDEVTFTPSSGNVFADLGDPAPQEALLKAQLAQRIGAAIRERGLTQKQAAALLAIDQPKVSALLSGRLIHFSVARLLKYVAELGNNVDIVVHSTTTEKPGKVQVHDLAAAGAVLGHAQKQLGSLGADALVEGALSSGAGRETLPSSDA